MCGKTYRELFGDRDFSILVATPQNIYYTTGFCTTARRPYQIGYNCALMTPEKTYFLFPAGWAPLVEEQVNEKLVGLVPYYGGVDELAKKISEMTAGEEKIGIEEDGMELVLYLALKREWRGKNGSEEWENVTSCFQNARLIKTQLEIQAIRASAAVARSAMEYAKKIISPGMTETELAAELECFMKKNGSEGVPFTMKALTGENAVRTINLPGENRIQKGSMILLDFGAVVQHYASDWTRTFAVGECSDEQKELYDLVWKMERSCIELIRPGTTYKDLMNRAMEVVAGHPYEPWFNPYLGHSVGISSQEWPAIIPSVDQRIKENMVITIEPGIYIPGLGGLRIEDMVLVTENGHEILTGLTEETFVI